MRVLKPIFPRSALHHLISPSNLDRWPTLLHCTTFVARKDLLLRLDAGTALRTNEPAHLAATDCSRFDLIEMPRDRNCIATHLNLGASIYFPTNCFVKEPGET